MTATDKRYVVPKPCAKCPFRAKFRGDDDYLRPGRRAGIARGLLEGSDFPCHETIEHDDSSCDGESDDCAIGGVTCAGASLVMLRAGHEGPLKIPMRLGLVDPDEFEASNAKVALWTLSECLYELDDLDTEDEDTCGVVNPGCEAPAGYMIGGEAVPGADLVDTRCPVCGEFVCDNCSDDDGHCRNGMCSEEEPDDADW